jgi:hypothetical protein
MTTSRIVACLIRAERLTHRRSRNASEAKKWSYGQENCEAVKRRLLRAKLERRLDAGLSINNVSEFELETCPRENT